MPSGARSTRATLKKKPTKPAAANGLQQQARFEGRKMNLSHVFAGQNVVVTQVSDRIWLVTFMQYDLGHFDDETCRRISKKCSTD
jgi:hypothetical protein